MGANSRIDLEVMREIAFEASRLCVIADRHEAGSDLAKTLSNCDRFVRLMAGEIDCLRAANAALLAACESTLGLLDWWEQVNSHEREGRKCDCAGCDQRRILRAAIAQAGGGDAK